MVEALEETLPAATPVRTGFANRVAAVFATRVAMLGLSILTSLTITRLLTPADRGAYVAVVTLPAMLQALAVFGLPNAVNYFSGRGDSVRSLIRASLIFAAVISVFGVGLVLLALPFLERTILSAAPDYLIKVMLLIIPISVMTGFGGTLLYGRQRIRAYNLIMLLGAMCSLTGAVVLVGFCGLGLNGAVAANVVMNLLTGSLVMVEVARLDAADKRGNPASLRSLIGYGARLYPASLSGYYNYRADNNIIQAVAPNSRVAQENLGQYSWAVTMAEVVFLVPESVAALFLPRVAGASHEESSVMLGLVSRVTLLLSIAVALALIPAAWLGVYLVVPTYANSLPAFLAILPGVVALSMVKVMSSYVGGRGRPGPASVSSTIALGLNLPLNFALIPVLGIVGASLSSVASYSALALMMTLVASRMSGQSLATLCVPRRSDIVLIIARLAGAAARLRRRGAGGRSG
jgi:antigen flippase